MSLDESLKLLVKMMYLTAPFGIVSVLILLFYTPWLVEKDQGGFKGFCWMVFIMILTILAAIWLGTVALGVILWIAKILVNLSIEWWEVYKSI